MTDKEALKRWPLVVSGFTGILASGMSEFHADVERVLERPVFTHEFADKEVTAEIREAYRAEFLELVEREIT